MKMTTEQDAKTYWGRIRYEISMRLTIFHFLQGKPSKLLQEELINRFHEITN